MKVEELRIGNILGFYRYDSKLDIKLPEYDFPQKVLKISKRVICCCGIKENPNEITKFNYFKSYDIFGIPISERWLFDLGFQKIGGYTYPVFHKKIDKISLNFELKDGELLFNSESKSLIGFKHVHQLQNIVFALTGKELKL